MLTQQLTRVEFCWNQITITFLFVCLFVFFFKKQMVMVFGSRFRGVLLGTVIGLGLAGLLAVWNREDFYMKHQSVTSYNAGK